MIGNSFIKDDKLLMETSRVDDLLDWDEKIDSFCDLLDSVRRSGAFGFISSFGTGKSTLIENVKRKRGKEERRETWIEFDAWKFPERRDLWEGFVLEVADQFGEKRKIQGLIDGKDSKSKIFDLATDILGLISENLKGLGFLDKFTELFARSPATRVFEIQNIFQNILKKIDNDIYIVVEDIDRSGDYGIYFLETLKQFIDNLDYGKKIIIIVPMDNEKFEEKMDSFLKCLNFVEYFSADNIKLGKFIDEIFEIDFIKDSIFRGQTVSLLEYFFTSNSGMTIRFLKFILRKANANFKRQVINHLDPDFRMTLILELSKYIKDSNGLSYFKLFKRDQGRTKNYGSIFDKLFFMIHECRDSLYVTDDSGNVSISSSPKGFNFTNRKRDGSGKPYPNIPTRGTDSTGNGCYFIPDFYLNY